MYRGERRYTGALPWRIAGILAGVLLLNLLLSIYLWYPEYEFLRILAPTPELLGVFLCVLGVSTLPVKHSRWPLLFLSLPVLVYILFGAGEALMRHAFRRSFVPWTELQLVPAMLNMIFKSSAFGGTIVIIVLTVVTLFAATGPVFLLLRWIEINIRSSGGLPAVAVLFLLLALGLFSGFGRPLTLLMIRQLDPPEPVEYPVRSRLSQTPSIPTNRAGTGVREPGPLPKLAGRDVFVFVIESYGHTLLANPNHYAKMKTAFEQTEARLYSSGFTVLSHFLESSTFGGMSWLAEAAFLTGVRIDTQHRYNQIMRSGIRNMTHLFNESGYLTVMAAPGSQSATETWRRFYQFDEYFFLGDITYRGPYFCFGVMPDQFLLNDMRKRVLARDRDAPLFIEFILVSSHTPFNYIPAYIEDWDSIGDGSEYHETSNEFFRNNWLTGGEYPEGYTTSIRYVLKVLSEYMVQYIPDDALIIVYGDHQPKFPVSERGAPLSVPIHIISRDRNLVEPFAYYGYTHGLRPNQPLPHPGIETFYPAFLEVMTGEAESRIELDRRFDHNLVR